MSEQSGVDVVHHLVMVNGTEDFYKNNFDVGLRGILNIMDATLKLQTRHVIVSSAEVYQTADQIPQQKMR